jgi:hypothetical protein
MNSPRFLKIQRPFGRKRILVDFHFIMYLNYLTTILSKYLPVLFSRISRNCGGGRCVCVCVCGKRGGAHKSSPIVCKGFRRMRSETRLTVYRSGEMRRLRRPVTAFRSKRFVVAFGVSLMLLRISTCLVVWVQSVFGNIAYRSFGRSCQTIEVSKCTECVIFAGVGTKVPWILFCLNQIHLRPYFVGTKDSCIPAVPS